jgi:hypothetical protein
MDLGEALEDGDEASVFALGDLDVDDVVVEIVGSVGGSDRQELRPRGMDEY